MLVVISFIPFPHSAPKAKTLGVKPKPSDSASENKKQQVSEQFMLLTHLPLVRIYASVNWVSIG